MYGKAGPQDEPVLQVGLNCGLSAPRRARIAVIAMICRGKRAVDSTEQDLGALWTVAWAVLGVKNLMQTG